jgi:phage terminase Nu1 subunit (DNA packaging protein)
MSAPNFLRLVDSGVFERAERGTYDLEDVRKRYILYIREIASGRSPKGDFDPLQERARKDKELADKTALQNQVTRGELLSGAAVSKLVIDAFSKVRSRLFALPTKLAPVVLHLETLPEVQAKLMDGVNDALAELSEADILRAAGADTARSVADVSQLVPGSEAAAPADSEPVGRQRAASEPRGQRRARTVGYNAG